MITAKKPLFCGKLAGNRIAKCLPGQAVALFRAKIDRQGSSRSRSRAVRQISPAASVNEPLVRVGDPQVSGRNRPWGKARKLAGCFSNRIRQLTSSALGENMSVIRRNADRKSSGRVVSIAVAITTSALLVVGLAGAQVQANPAPSPSASPQPSQETHTSAQQQSVSTYIELRNTRVQASRARQMVSLNKAIAQTKAAMAHAHVNGKLVLKIAAKFKGVPYRTGGSTPAGFDCSGYTKYVFKQIGIELPRVAQEQLNWTTPVSAADAQPGDLAFYMSGKYAYHAAIYAGNGMIWHSPHTGAKVEKVRIRGHKMAYGRVPASAIVPGLAIALDHLYAQLHRLKSLIHPKSH
jgi:cell wall-associated NlpC family hydrolase